MLQKGGLQRPPFFGLNFGTAIGVVLDYTVWFFGSKTRYFYIN